jgi:hypothetical protein
MNSTKNKARAAGLLYPLTAIIAPFSLLHVPVPGRAGRRNGDGQSRSGFGDASDLKASHSEQLHALAMVFLRVNNFGIGCV